MCNTIIEKAKEIVECMRYDEDLTSEEKLAELDYIIECVKNDSVEILDSIIMGIKLKYLKKSMGD